MNQSSRAFQSAIGIVSALLLLSFSPALLAQEPSVSKDTPVWIDVRTWVEHQTNHIDGDARFHYTEIVESVAHEYPDKSTPIRLYCAAGVRAAKARTALVQAGYSNVENAGGIQDVRRQRGLSPE